MRRFLFLYTELAEYFLNCARKLHARNDAEVHIVRWPVNEEAPFEFEIPEDLTLYNKGELSEEDLQELVEGIRPDVILSSGWIDKQYLKLVKEWCEKVPTVLILDNQWEGSFRQRIGRIWASYRIKPYFSHSWVPGDPQLDYALRIGFPRDRILEGFYVADVERFGRLKEERDAYPPRFLYLGRYVEHKGIRDLWKAFEELKKDRVKGSEKWELYSCGTGTLYPERPEMEGLHHLGFVQPRDIPQVMLDCSVFVFPSHFEPWGVAVQEFGASGGPLLLSDRVGAGSAFLEEGGSGHSFPSGDREALKEKMENFMSMEAGRLAEMGERAHQLASHPDPYDWAERAYSILD